MMVLFIETDRLILIDLIRPVYSSPGDHEDTARAAGTGRLPAWRVPGGRLPLPLGRERHGGIGTPDRRPQVRSSGFGYHERGGRYERNARRTLTARLGAGY